VTLVLVKAQLSGYEDYPIQFDDPRAFLPLGLSVAAVALLCAPSLREWCDS